MSALKQKKVECLWSHIVGSSSIDINSNSLSLFNIIEEISSEVQLQADQVNAELVLPLSYEVISLWEKSGFSGKEVSQDIIVSLYSPSNKLLQEFTYTLVIPHNKERMRFRANVTGLKYEVDGKYEFRIGIKENKGVAVVGTIPVLVKVNKSFVSPIKK